MKPAASTNARTTKGRGSTSGRGGAYPTYAYVVIMLIFVACMVIGFTKLATSPNQPLLHRLRTAPPRRPDPDVNIGTQPPKVAKKKIAYAITVTLDGHFLDGALVLGHSILKVHDESKGQQKKYSECTFDQAYSVPLFRLSL
jgi:hypothetical protein